MIEFGYQAQTKKKIQEPSSLEKLKELTLKLEKAEKNQSLTVKKLQVALAAAGAGIWDWEINPDILKWDERMVDLFDYTPYDFEKDSEGWYICKYSDFFSRVHPEDRTKVQSSINSCLFHNTPYKIRYRVIREDGTEFSVIQASGDIFHTIDGEAERMIGVCIPITEVKCQ